MSILTICSLLFVRQQMNESNHDMVNMITPKVFIRLSDGEIQSFPFLVKQIDQD